MHYISIGRGSYNVKYVSNLLVSLQNLKSLLIKYLYLNANIGDPKSSAENP